MRGQRHRETVEPVGSAAGRAEDVGLGLHGHDPLHVPAFTVAGGPGRVGRNVHCEGHERPRGLLAGVDVVLGLGEQIGKRVGAAGDDERHGEW